MAGRGRGGRSGLLRERERLDAQLAGAFRFAAAPGDAAAVGLHLGGGSPRAQAPRGSGLGEVPFAAALVYAPDLVLERCRVLVAPVSAGRRVRRER